MKDFYSVKELAELCSVSEQAIRAYLAREGCAKVASKWQPTQDELRKLFKHYGVDVAQLEQESQESDASNTKNTNSVAQDSQAEETAGQTAILLEMLEMLKEQVKTKDKQLEQASLENKKLLDEIAAKSEQINELIKTNNNLSLPQATKAFSEAQEIMNIETTQETKEKESADAVKPDSMTNDEWAKLGTWERLKRAWKGILNG